MDIKEQVTKWVENKIEKVLNKDLNEKIQEESSPFDVEAYVNTLLVKYFTETDLSNLKESLKIDSNDSYLPFESGNSSEERISSHGSSEFESNECQTYSADEMIKNLENDSKDVKAKYLRILDASVEDLINQNYWGKIKESLQKNLSQIDDREMQNLILKMFQKLLKCFKKPQIICKGFISVAEITENQINLFNLENESSFFEEIYDIKEKKWYYEKNLLEFKLMQSEDTKSSKTVNLEVMIKLMWLLIDCQQQIPIKWVRFNEMRFREIIFSFIHLLCASTPTDSESTKLSGLELLSVLNPTASWCCYWCHTAVGRSLLCSAFRKYKNFFIHMIGIILRHIKAKKTNRLPSVTDGVGLNKHSSKFTDNYTEADKALSSNSSSDKSRKRLSPREKNNYNRSVSNEFIHKNLKNSKKSKNKAPEWVLGSIPRCVVNEAVFFHSISVITSLIQFRSGRALFPVQTPARKRLLNVPDLALSIIDFLENQEDYKWDNDEITFTITYRSKVTEMLNILKKVRTHVNSSRMSAEKQHFYFF